MFHDDVLSRIRCHGLLIGVNESSDYRLVRANAGLLGKIPRIPKGKSYVKQSLSALTETDFPAAIDQ